MPHVHGYTKHLLTTKILKKVKISEYHSEKALKEPTFLEVRRIVYVLNVPYWIKVSFFKYECVIPYVSFSY